MALGQDHHAPVRAIVLLKLLNHLDHGLISEALAENSLDYPLLAPLRHSDFSVLLSDQLKQTHVIQCGLARVRDRSLVEHELVLVCFQLAAQLTLGSFELRVDRLFSFALERPERYKQFVRLGVIAHTVVPPLLRLICIVQTHRVIFLVDLEVTCAALRLRIALVSHVLNY